MKKMTDAAVLNDGGFRVEYEKILAQKGTRTYRVSRADAFSWSKYAGEIAALYERMAYDEFIVTTRADRSTSSS